MCILETAKLSQTFVSVLFLSYTDGVPMMSPPEASPCTTCSQRNEYKKKNIFQQLTSWKALNGQMIEIFYFLPLHLIHSSPYVEGGEGGAVRVSGCVHGWSGERAVSGIRIHPVWTCCQCIVHYESACPQICSGKFSGSRRKDLMSRSQNSSENSDWACGKLTELKRRYLVVINNIIYTYIY